MQWHWSGLARLIAIIVGLGVGIWEKFVLGGGWIPTIVVATLVFLAIQLITGVISEVAGRLMEWREIKLRSDMLGGSAPMDTGDRSVTPPRHFPPPWRLVEMAGGYAVEDANGQQLGVFYGSRRVTPDIAQPAQTLTMDEARRMATNFARLPELLKRDERAARARPD